MRDVNLNALWCRAIVEELARSGVSEAVICPGSRSAPLALAFAEAKEVRHWSVVDERSAGFFALGLSKYSQNAVALVCTSGTAGANFYPAVVEASLSGIPLIVLTADRPWELQGWGAPQTVDQSQFYGRHVRQSVDLACPEALDASVLHLRATVDRAVATAIGPRRGPVHLNVPFREPLAPSPDCVDLSGLSALALEGRTEPHAQNALNGGPVESAARTHAQRLSREGSVESVARTQAQMLSREGSAESVARTQAQRLWREGHTGSAGRTDAQASMPGQEARTLRAAPAHSVPGTGTGGETWVQSASDEVGPVAGCSPASSGSGTIGLPLVRSAPSVGDVAAFADEVRARLTACERGLIVLGPRDRDDGVAELAFVLGKALQYPVVAEACSQARFLPEGQNAVVHADLFLRSEAIKAALKPELVIRLGGGITTRALMGWLDTAQDVISVSDSLWMDPHHRASLRIEGSPAKWLGQFQNERPRRSGTWRQQIERLERASRESLDAQIEKTPGLSEGHVARIVRESLPEGGLLFVSSSMPIRSLETFGGKGGPAIRVLSNRGANGIDGVVSTALGAAAAANRPAVLLVGDLAFLHDLNAFSVAKRHGLSMTVVVVNNDGGGIFSHLPVARLTPHFETLFGTPHGLTFEPLAALFGVRHERVTDRATLASTLRGSLEGGLHLLEVRTQRTEEAQRHRDILELALPQVEASSWRI